MTAGYSATPLLQKLGIKEKAKVRFINEPAHLADLLGPLPDGVTLVESRASGVDYVHCFVTQKPRLVALLPGLMNKMARDGMIWISWPKKSSKVQTDITEDTIREVALPLGLVDVKVCAIDETWSGLKLVIRSEIR